MTIHSKKKIEELKWCRQRGYSINELVTKFSIPKTTVWHHVHNVPVFEKYRAILRSKQGGTKKKKEEDWKTAREKAGKLLQEEHRELVIMAAMLYWGEGSKKVCELINSDGNVIKIYLIFLRNILKISEYYIKPTLRIFSGMDEAKSLEYWSTVTHIPKNRFLIRLNDGGTKSRTQFGMCRITVRKGHKILKLIQSIIELVSSETIKKF